MSHSKENVLREEEIRPDHLKHGEAEHLAADIRRIIAHNDEFVSVPCPACGHPEARKTLEKCGFTFMTCSTCETMYTSPRPTPDLLKEYYETSESYAYWNKHIFPASENIRRTKIFKPRVERIIDICKRNNVTADVLLEVGAGFGTFCEEMQRAGFFRRVIAIEPTPGLAQTCRDRNLEVIESPVEQVALDCGSVDVVASFEVIEHLFSPKDFIRHCASLLKREGLLVITCPNIKGFDIVQLQELSTAIDTEHLNYFHPSSIAHLLTECDFDVLEIFTPGKLDAELVRKEVLGGNLDLSNKPFLKQILIEKWEKVGDNFQKFLADNMLSSHMWVVAKKK